ncbi:MAG: type II toxin-antitoxin system HicA family toxin [Verrucomicrobia bacterium]|nr:type II toxin-antitoxin system HicA family toxin [Verrucomicrobiota bacterium]
MPHFTPQDWRTLEKIFLAVGFRFARQEGSHRSYVKPGTARPVIIPAYREVPVFVIRNNLKTAGITREEYFRLLQEHQ